MPDMDSFKELKTTEQLEQLLTVLDSDFPHSLHYCDFLRIIKKWKTQINDLIFKVYVPNTEDLSCGTSLAVFSMSAKSPIIYMIYSLEPSGKTLQQALETTSIIDWKNQNCEWEAIHEKHIDILRNILESKKIHGQYLPHYQYYMPIEEAIDVSIGYLSDATITKLNGTHANLVNQSWKYHTDETIHMTKACIELNFGFAIEKQNKLLSWIVQTHYGGMGMLYTIESQRNQGYGQLLARKYTKHMAELNKVPSVVIHADNIVSTRLNEKIGYRKICSVIWIVFDEY